MVGAILQHEYDNAPTELERPGQQATSSTPPIQYLGIVLGDRSVTRTGDGVTLGPVEFGGKGQAWAMLKMLIEAGAAGVSCRAISDAFAKPYDRKAEVQAKINGSLRLDIRTIGKNWTLVHIPKPGEKSPGNS